MSERKIVDALFANYNENVKPSRRVDLSVILRFFSLLYIQQKEELVTFSADFEMTWVDPSLVWNPSDYNGRDIIHIPENTVWRPDFTVYNSVSQTSVISEENRLTTVTNIGEVQLSNPSVYVARCKMNVRMFPFDTQNCTLTMSSWVYESSELTATAPVTKFNISNKEAYIGNSEWELVSLTGTNWNETDEDGTVFQAVYFMFTIRRLPAYYIFVLFIPTFIVTTLSFFGLFTPFNDIGERVERVTLGLTTLLSLAVVLNIVGDDMPKSTTLPHLGSFILAEIILCFIGVIVSIVLLFLQHRAHTRKIVFPGTRGSRRKTTKGGMGLRVLDSSLSADQLHDTDKILETLQKTSDYIDWVREFEEHRLKWIIFLNHVDIFFLLLFQAVNVILFLCYLFAH